jgi:hypothetical protein
MTTYRLHEDYMVFSWGFYVEAAFATNSPHALTSAKSQSGHQRDAVSV